jgi:hypothetical protein
MTMRKLMVTPSQASYSAQLGSEVLQAQVAGGPSRRRRDFIGAPTYVSVTWLLPGSGFQYLEAFYRTATVNGTDPFLIDLVIDDASLEEYTAMFVPGSYMINGVQGDATSVSAQLEVEAKVPDADLDNAILDLYELYGDEMSTWFEALAVLVNVTLPAALP